MERSGGRNTPLLLGKPTVVLVFGSECPHCLEVAPLWRSWIETNGSDWEVLAVSSEPFEAAQAFAEGQEWGLEVGVVEADPTVGSASALTGRAPWVFVANGAGVILAEGHGNRIAELTADSRTEPGGRRKAMRCWVGVSVCAWLVVCGCGAGAPEGGTEVLTVEHDAIRPVSGKNSDALQ